MFVLCLFMIYIYIYIYIYIWFIKHLQSQSQNLQIQNSTEAFCNLWSCKSQSYNVVIQNSTEARFKMTSCPSQSLNLAIQNSPDKFLMWHVASRKSSTWFWIFERDCGQVPIRSRYFRFQRSVSVSDELCCLSVCKRERCPGGLTSCEKVRARFTCQETFASSVLTF